MLKGIRQIAMMVNDLEDTLTLYQRVLGMTPCHRETLEAFGLRNAVLPAGEGTFVELLQPTDPNAAGARFLQRKGEGMYLLIFDTDQYDRLLAHLKEQGARITQASQGDHGRSAFLHPGTANGVFIQLNETPHGENPWPAAGNDWFRQSWHPLTKRLRQVAVLVRDLDAAVKQWERLFGLQESNRFHISFAGMDAAVLPLNDGATCIELAQPTVPDRPAARYLERYGEGLYLLIFEVDSLSSVTDHLKQTGTRMLARDELAPGYRAEFSSVWLHPRAMKGVFTQLSEVEVADHPWPPAGEIWRTKG